MFRIVFRPFTGFFLFFSLLLSCASAQNIPADRLRDYPVQILQKINRYRNSIGLSSLEMADPVTRQAQNHSNDMAKGRTAFGHEGFNQRFANVKKSMSATVAGAENVAYGYPTPTDVVNGWLNSPVHLHNIQGNFRYTGIGIARRKDGLLFYTQLFIR